MFATVYQMDLKPGLQVTWAEEWVSLIEQQPGFRGFLYLSEVGNRSHEVVVTLWVSAEAADRFTYNTDYLKLRQNAIAPALVKCVETPTNVFGYVLQFDGR